MQASAPADVSETYLSSLLDDKFLRSLSDVRDVDEALKIVTIDLDPTAAVYQLSWRSTIIDSLVVDAYLEIDYDYDEIDEEDEEGEG